MLNESQGDDLARGRADQAGSVCLVWTKLRNVSCSGGWALYCYYTGLEGTGRCVPLLLAPGPRAVGRTLLL
jgi:hypothetical protein